MWEIPACSVDTLLDRKDCVTNLKEWVKYNLDDFPGLRGMLNDVILDLKVKTKNKPIPIDSKYSEEFINYLSKQTEYDDMMVLLHRYEEFIKTGGFYVIDQQVYTDVTKWAMLKYYAITISPEKDWINTLRVNYDVFTNKKHK